MTTSDIGVDTVIETGNSRFGQNGLGEDFSYLHIQHYKRNSFDFVAPFYIWGKIR
jgi:hypothetical protein